MVPRPRRPHALLLAHARRKPARRTGHRPGPRPTRPPRRQARAAPVRPQCDLPRIAVRARRLDHGPQGLCRHPGRQRRRPPPSRRSARSIRGSSTARWPTRAATPSTSAAARSATRSWHPSSTIWAAAASNSAKPSSSRTTTNRTTGTSSPTTTSTISGLVYAPAVGVWVLQSGRNQIVHNHIHDLFYTAISVGWTWGYGRQPVQGQRHRVQPPARHRQGNAERHGRHLHPRHAAGDPHPQQPDPRRRLVHLRRLGHLPGRRLLARC